jgi:hypothetical protein
MRHRKIISCVAVGLVLGLASLAGAGVGAAQNGGDFLYDVRNNGRIAGPDDKLMELGGLACANQQNGVPFDQTISAIVSYSNLSSRRDAEFIYESALIFLC